MNSDMIGFMLYMEKQEEEERNRSALYQKYSVTFTVETNGSFKVKYDGKELNEFWDYDKTCNPNEYRLLHEFCTNYDDFDKSKFEITSDDDNYHKSYDNNKHARSSMSNIYDSDGPAEDRLIDHFSLDSDDKLSLYCYYTSDCEFSDSEVYFDIDDVPPQKLKSALKAAIKYSENKDNLIDIDLERWSEDILDADIDTDSLYDIEFDLEECLVECHNAFLLDNRRSKTLFKAIFYLVNYLDETN